jgi:hypothetical protein
MALPNADIVNGDIAEMANLGKPVSCICDGDGV